MEYVGCCYGSTMCSCLFKRWFLREHLMSRKNCATFLNCITLGRLLHLSEPQFLSSVKWMTQNHGADVKFEWANPYIIACMWLAPNKCWLNKSLNADSVTIPFIWPWSKMKVTEVNCLKLSEPVSERTGTQTQELRRPPDS